jgi:hypothetical protein
MDLYSSVDTWLGCALRGGGSAVYFWVIYIRQLGVIEEYTFILFSTDEYIYIYIYIASCKDMLVRVCVYCSVW